MTEEVFIHEGNHKTMRFKLWDRLSILDPTGLTIFLTVKDSQADADPGLIQKKSTTGDITIVDAAKGLIDVAFIPSDTTAKGRAKEYWYDFRVKTAGGLEYNCDSGKFFIRDVTTNDIA